MTKTPDFAKAMQDMMAAFPVDAAAFQNAFKTQAAMAEKLSKVALEAAEKSTEITSKWAKETIAKMKKGVRIINCARGGLVDEQALREAGATITATDHHHHLTQCPGGGGMQATARSASFCRHCHNHSHRPITNI